MARPPIDTPGGRGRSGSGALVATGAAVLVLFGVYVARDVIGPLAIAIVIVIVCLPLGGVVARRTGQRWMGTTTIIALAYAVILAAGVLIWLAGAQLAQLIADLSSGEALAHVVDTWNSWVETLTHSAAPGDQAAGGDVASVLLGALEQASSAIASTTIALFFVCAYIVVIAVDAGRYTRAATLFGSSRSETIARVARLNSGIRRYYVVNSIFGAVVATIDGFALWALGVPAPFLWAVLAFVTNFIPTIGFVIGLVPPALLALAVGGWPLFLGVIAVYCVVNVVLQVFVQPKFVSEAVSISLTLSFFAVVFWTFVIGPVGAILAIPLTLLARSLLLEGRVESGWWRWLSGDDSAHDRPDERY